MSEKNGFVQHKGGVKMEGKFMGMKPKISDVEFLHSEKHGMLCLKNEDGKFVAEKIKSVSGKIRETIKKEGLLNKKSEPILCKCGHDKSSHLTDGTCTGYNEIRENCGCLEFEPEPSQENQLLMNTNVVIISSSEKPLSDEDIVKIWYFEKYKLLIAKEDIAKAMHYEFNHIYTFDEVVEILKNKDNQFKAILNKRIAEIKEISELHSGHAFKEIVVEKLEKLKEID